MITDTPLYIYNTLTRKDEEFKPLRPPLVGLYVCGPTVYGDPHLGHARAAITFDIVFRYLSYLGYKVRYVRNITDVGHLENDADEGEDKIQKKAQLDSLEPMEVVQYYTNRYHDFLDMLNLRRPSIEPSASGHIIEQQEMIQQILDNGFAYEVEGSVYFDVLEYNKKYPYGKLSGRVVEDLLANTRQLDGQAEKRNSFDFALWKKASPKHIMRWKSPWSNGYPGWHLECSVMSTKYLGAQFDIHGGGLDLQFPHHECEIAQSVAASGEDAVKYWMHNNMITINGQKMGKSLGNFITLEEFFNGEHPLLEKAYSPMTVRFFMLQAHYRSPLDFSNEALQAAEKGMKRLFAAMQVLNKLKPSAKTTVNAVELKQKCFNAISQDFNTPILISHLFDAVKLINSVHDGKETIDEDNLDVLRTFMHDFVYTVLGLKAEETDNKATQTLDKVISLLLQTRVQAKADKNYALADKIRDDLQALGVQVKDRKDGFEWEFIEES